VPPNSPWSEQRPIGPARRLGVSDDWNSDDDWGGESWEDDPADLVACPSCGAEIYEESVQCPICGDYVTRGVRSGSLWEGRPIWWIVLGLIGIMAVIAMLVR